MWAVEKLDGICRGKPVPKKPAPRSLNRTRPYACAIAGGLFPNMSARSRRDIRPGAITMTVVLRSGQLNTGVQLGLRLFYGLDNEEDH